MLLLQLREKRSAGLAFSWAHFQRNEEYNQVQPQTDHPLLVGPLLIETRASIFSSVEEIQITFSSNFYWNICVKICNLEQMIAIVKKPWHRPIMGVARYGLLVSDRIIMNLDGTQNNGGAFLAFFTEILSFRKKILYSLCRLSVSSFLRSRFSCSVSRVRFWRFQHPLKRRLGTNCS